MRFPIIIDDAKLWAITAARLAYNAGLPPTVPDPAHPGAEIPNPAIIPDNAAYVQYVMVGAVNSWVSHFPEASPAFPQGDAPCAAIVRQAFAAARGI